MDIAAKLATFLNQTESKSRTLAGISSSFDTRYQKFSRMLCHCRASYGKAPRICADCLGGYREICELGIELEIEITAHADRLHWLAPRLRNRWLCAPALWAYGIVASIIVGICTA